MHVGNVGDACQHARAIGVAQTALHIVFCRIISRIDGMDGREIPIQGQGVFHGVPFMHESLQGIERTSAFDTCDSRRTEASGRAEATIFRSVLCANHYSMRKCRARKADAALPYKLVTRRKPRTAKGPSQDAPPNETELIPAQQSVRLPSVTKAHE